VVPGIIAGMGDVVDLLDRPTYGFSQIDAILGIKSGTAARWIDGYDRHGKHYQPVIREATLGNDVATWGEFVEARMLAEYRTAGVKIIRMRPALEVLREELGTRYPLASARIWLGTDGRDLVRRVQEEVQLDSELAIVLVRTKQEMLPGGLTPIKWSGPAQLFRDSLEWSDAPVDTAVPERVLPQAGNTGVVIDPLRAFGDPVVRGRNVPTNVIAELVRAGDTPAMIADLYDLSIDEVNAAIRYELFLRQAS
jgi:uncharacterized protein (DUF433 family)